MDFREWQEQARLQHISDNTINNQQENSKFFGRKEELQELKLFLDDKETRIFGVYGVPMIGKSTLINNFLNNLNEYEIEKVQLLNNENPEITLEDKLFSNPTHIKWEIASPKIIVIENFEIALSWGGSQNHLHEIKYKKVITILQ